MPGNHCAKGQERTNPISSHLEQGPQFIETKIITARSAETVPGSDEQSAPITLRIPKNTVPKVPLAGR